MPPTSRQSLTAQSLLRSGGANHQPPNNSVPVYGSKGSVRGTPDYAPSYWYNGGWYYFDDPGFFHGRYDSRAESRSHASDRCAAYERARRTQWLAVVTRELHLIRRVRATLVQHTGAGELRWRVPPLYPLTRAHEGRAGLSAVDSATRWGRPGGAAAADRRRWRQWVPPIKQVGHDSGWGRTLELGRWRRSLRRRRATGSSPRCGIERSAV